MKVLHSNIPDIIIIEPQCFGDERGFFLESFHEQHYAEIGIANNFKQDNLSRSSHGILRGLHYQVEQPQGKLIFVARGEIFDVAVDIRQGSPSFGQYTSTILNDENHRQIYIPPGFAHGFCVLSEKVDMIYKCTDYYSKQSERGILWNDPTVNINWPAMDFTLSERDQGFLALNDIAATDLPSYKK